MAHSKVPLFCIHCSGLTFLLLYNVILLFSSHSVALNRTGITWDWHLIPWALDKVGTYLPSSSSSTFPSTTTTFF